MSGSMNPGDKSSAQIEREVESTRARLTNTLEALRERVSPGQLMDQAVEYVRGSGGSEFAQNLGKAVRDNPLPVVLIGAGLGWLLLSGGRSSSSDGVKPRRASGVGHGAAPALVPQDASYNAQHGSTVGEGPSLAERAGSTASGIGERVSDVASQAYQSVSGTAEAAADSLVSATGAARQRVTELSHDLRDHASGTGEAARQGLGWMLQEQPLVLGAIGIAVGAAVGALLPGTKTEDRLMGEASDAVTQQVKAVAQEGYERAQEVAGEQLDRAKSTAAEAYDATKDKLNQAGLSPSRVGDALGAVAQEARQAVRDGAQTVAGQVRGTIDQADPGKGSKT